MSSRFKGMDLNSEASEANQECSLIKNSISGTPVFDGGSTGGFVNGGARVLGGTNDLSSTEGLKGKKACASRGVLGMAGMSNVNRGLNLGFEGKPLSTGLEGNAKTCIQDGDCTIGQGAKTKGVMADGGTGNAVGVGGYPRAQIPKRSGKENQVEKEGEYYAADLVWGKVRSHPWWPGQIVDPSAASEKAMRHFKKESYLIAYFGDHSFAWNEASKIKPFGMYFTHMTAQSTSQTFCDAVRAAVGEFSRRIEFGLACQCLPEDVLAKVRFQGLINACVREHPALLYGGDSSSTAASFDPEKIVSFLKTLATSPRLDYDVMKFVITRAELKAFYRQKGYYQLPKLEEWIGDLKDDTDLHASIDLDHMIDLDVNSSDDYADAYGKRKSPSSDSQLDKPDEILGEEKKPRLELISGSSSSFQKGENKTEGKADGEKEPVVDPVYAEGMELNSGSSSSFQNGENKTEEKADGEKEPVVDPVYAEGMNLNSGSNSSFQNGENKSEERAASQKEPVADPVNAEETAKPVRRGPGRPRKAVVHPDQKLLKTPESGISSSTSEKHQESPPVRRGPGRPRKASVNPGPKHLKAAESGTTSLTSEKHQECPPASEILSKLAAAAANPMHGCHIPTSVAGALGCFRNYTSQESGENKDTTLSSPNQPEPVESEAVGDSCWTDKVIQPVIGPPPIPVGVPPEEYSPTALVLKFSDLRSLPSIAEMNRAFGRFGAMEESLTKVFTKTKHVRMVFKRTADAEYAYSSPGKYALFGHYLLSYRLIYDYKPLPSKPSAKRSRK